MCRANREIDVEDLISDFLLSRCPGLHGLALKGPDPKRRMIRRYSVHRSGGQAQTVSVTRCGAFAPNWRFLGSRLRAEF